MNENDTKAAVAALRAPLQKLIESETPRQPEHEAILMAAVTLAEGFIVNVARIADALEQIAENTK